MDQTPVLALAKAMLARLMANKNDEQRAEIELLLDNTELEPSMQRALEAVVGVGTLQRMEDDSLLAALGLHRDDIER